jgi:hypothetical protein
MDYNGALAELGEELIPNFRGGAPIAPRKLNVMGPDDKTRIDNHVKWFGNAKFASPYAVPDDPNHTHYYIWRWLAQLSAGANECVHHAIAGEANNDITVTGLLDDGLLRMSSYDRTADRFIVLIARDKADILQQNISVSIPSQIRKGAVYHRDGRFVGEGLKDGERYQVRWTSEDINARTGYSTSKANGNGRDHVVRDGLLTVDIPAARRLTTIVFEKQQ